MEWINIIIPIITAILLTLCILKRQKKEVAADPEKAKKYSYKNFFILYWLVPILSSVCLIAIIAMVMRANDNSDTEYLSYYFTKICYEEPWNERVKSNKLNTATEEEKRKMRISERNQDYLYETVKHPAKWYGVTNSNKTIDIGKKEYERIKALWNTPEVFINKNRVYDTLDGNAYEHSWDNQDSTMVCWSETHQYQNKTLNSESAFSFREYTPEEKTKLGLYDYPEINNGVLNPIVGYSKYVSQADIDTLRYFNSKYGYSNQIQTLLLVFPNTAAAIAEEQRAYWQGGNKNEFVTCVGIDSTNNKVQWVKCFSWMDNSTLEVQCRNTLMKDSTLNIQNYYKILSDNLSLWKRKEFKDFDYISTNIDSDGQLAIFLTILIWNLILGGVCARFILVVYQFPMEKTRKRRKAKTIKE